MFGKNPIRSAENDGETLAVQEVFYTLQGEGPFAGSPATFIRLAGCNLACTFCDTEFESNIGNRMPPADIVKDVIVGTELALEPSEALRLVVITGGEPLRQNIVPLLDLLYEAGVRHVQIETAGTLWVPGLENYAPQELTIVCSPKTPRIHPMVYKHCTHYKYIISAGETGLLDGLPVRGTQQNTAHRLMMPVFRPWDMDGDWLAVRPTIWVSPCDAHDAEKTAANVKHAAEIAMKFSYRLTLQMHKLVGLP